ncbi:FAD-binding oxidoreductase [Saccharibacillus sp. CPCC 101409]|uniref:NAD(P)/FAD-dependent oxidoreductase n=1 Tax=Saccharibacillus sp. CPCC 101409 TaxID=3058041 RepID=UPI0026710BE6|nr:FAD-binding oxidoreductase [Saccharibacillus sp. CPCC 101409]MDO3408399.1 FAD-binding oxidoreductase [Saccharibacillus sp. CPCC 101409]
MKKIIVVGAGILGASAAYHLAKLGAEVTVVDRKHQGQATDAAAGIICPWLSQRRNQAWYRLARAGARYYGDLTQELHTLGERDTGYARVGALSLHPDPVKIAGMRERAGKRREDAPEIGDIEVLDESRVRELFPLLSGGYQAVRVSGAARVDGRALRDALLSGARKHGAVLAEGEAALNTDKSRTTGVTVDGKTLEADEVVVCAGAWANSLLRPLGLDFRVTYQKGQILHLQMPDRPGSGAWPVVIPPTDQYLLAFDDGRIVAGATHENEAELGDIRVTAGGMQEVLNKGVELAPGLADAEVEEVRVGFRPFTPGFLPVIGRVPGWEGLITANGLGASGLTVGPFLGSQLAKLALGLEPDIGLEDYGVEKALGTLRQGE